MDDNVTFATMERQCVLFARSHGDKKAFCRIYLIVVGAIGALLDAGVLLLVADLNAHDRVHVEAGQLPGLDDGYAYLEVLRPQMLIDAR